MAVEGQANGIAPDALFAQVRFSIVQSPALKAEDAEQVSDTICPPNKVRKANPIALKCSQRAWRYRVLRHFELSYDTP